ncbi:hypothetical protein [Streptomyces sp. NPDC012508]|uniref:hypothetical protein n=1 Tax=Streptomyces sp. NPDC012508 TaxID=3364837 RepID=UPI00369BEC62
MIEDAVPKAEEAWVVLVEEETTQSVEGHTHHRWHLTGTHFVGSRAAAEELAWKLARTYVPRDVELDPGATAARKVFRISDGSWLAEVRRFARRGVLCRISVGEQVYEQQYAPRPARPAATRTSPDPEAESPRKRRLFGRG